MTTALGDSLTFGFGLKHDEKWVNQIGAVNAGVNGDTSGGMLSRLDRDVISRGAEKVIVMGGTNDFIMGCDISVVKANLTAISQNCLTHSIKVIMANSIPVIPEMVPAFAAEFQDMRLVDEKLRAMTEWYEKYCRTWGFVFADTYRAFENAMREADDPRSLYRDGLHPSAAGAKVLTNAFNML